jgi:YbbR domain-containing protein
VAKVQNILKGLIPSNKKQWKIFLACLGISTVLWSLLRFSEERTDTIKVQLNFINYPKSQILVSSVPKAIPVAIQGRGFELISRSFGFRSSSIDIDLSKAKKLNLNDETHYLWLPNQHKLEIYQAIGSKLKIGDALSKVDTVKLIFSEKVEKELFTSFNYQVNKAREHFILKQPVVSPRKVIARGAKSKLKLIDTVYTELAELDLLDTDLNTTYKLQRFDGIDSLFEDSVKVYMEIEALKESNITIPISILNLPDSLEFKLFPNEVNVTFVCAESDEKEIQTEDFRASVRFEDIKSSFNRLNVILNQYPNTLKNLRIEPSSVEYIIKSKD